MYLQFRTHGCSYYNLERSLEHLEIKELTHNVQEVNQKFYCIGTQRFNSFYFVQSQECL